MSLKKDLLKCRHYFLRYLPSKDYRKRIASDNKQKLDALLGILDKIIESLLAVKKSKETTLEALGRVRRDELYERLYPLIERKFHSNLSMLPKISLNQITIYKTLDDGTVVDADLKFEIQGFENGRLFTAYYPLYIVDGYIRDPEIMFYNYQRLSLRDFLEEVRSDKYKVPEPQSEFHYVNERGRGYWYPEPTGPMETEKPIDHVWNPFRWR